MSLPSGKALTRLARSLLLSYQGEGGLGTRLLEFAERYARERGARQIYCTVAEENTKALQFFVRKRYIPAGRSASHYKVGISEMMLYKLFTSDEFEERFDRPHISVLPCEERHEKQVRALLLEELPRSFGGIDFEWVDALFQGYRRRDSRDVNLKYELIYIAVDRSNCVFGVAGATPKKGEPIKIMPFIATTLPSFVALLTDVPFALKPYGRKLYTHISPSADETIALQQRGWKLDAAMPSAYHEDVVTQQWSLDIENKEFMRLMRVKHSFLDAIKRREKTLEVRVAYESIRSIERGERIRMTSRSESEVIRVKDIRRYATFDAMLVSESAERIAPGAAKGDVLRLLREIYPPDKEKLGVVVLEIEPEGKGGPIALGPLS
jgi:ASC-1-like (ASCH) protein